MSETFYIKQFDTLEPVIDVLKDSAGNPINLTLADEVRFHVAKGTKEKPVLVFDKAATIVNAAGGTVKYGDPWAVSDTLVAGTFMREWLIVWGPGVTQRVPNNFDDKLVITPALGPNPL